MAPPEEAKSEEDKEVIFNESQEETFEVVGRVKVGEASGIDADFERVD